MSNAQNRPSKRCKCGNERAFTDNRPGSLRDSEGNFIGPACKTQELINSFINRPKAD